MPGWEIPTWWEISRRLEPWYPYSANSSAAPSRISSLRELRGPGAGAALPGGAAGGGGRGGRGRHEAPDDTAAPHEPHPAGPTAARRRRARITPTAHHGTSH